MNRNYLRTVYFFFLHLALLGCILNSEGIRDFWGGSSLNFESEHRHTMLRFHQRIDGNVPENAILFFGASHVQSLSVAAISPLTVNFGIGGDTTEGVLQRLPMYQSVARAKAIVIAVGFNDLKTNDPNAIKNAVENIQEVIETMPVSASIFLSEIHPVAQMTIGADLLNKKIGQTNQQLKRLSSNYAHVDFIPLPKQLFDGHQLSNSVHIGDGIHLNEVGYQYWIDHLKKTVTAI